MRCRAAEPGAFATASLIETPSLTRYRRIARPVCLPGRLTRRYGRRVPVWSAEVELDERLVRRLLGQFSELPVESLPLLAEGAGARRLGGRRAQALDPLREEGIDDHLLAALDFDLRPRAESLQRLLRHRLRETQPLEHGRPVWGA